MIKGLLPILYTSAGVTAAGITGYVVISPQLDEQVKPVEVVQPAVEQQKEEVASLSTHAEEEDSGEVQIDTPVPVPPKFTLLRVEKDGSTVIAGTGPSNSEVKLFDGETEIGTAVSGPSGDFAFVLDNPLSPGPHELHLSAKPKDGDVIASVESGLINVPQPEVDEEPTVLVSSEGSATKVLQKPELKEVPTVEAEEAADGGQAAETEIAAVEEPVADSADVVTSEPETKPAEQPKEVAQVLIEAADIEQGKVYIAGTGEPGTSVSIYFENELMGSTTVGSNGAFLFEGSREIASGRHNIRADMIDKSDGSVLARAEVRLVHEPQIVAEEPETEQEVVKAEVAEQEEAAEAQVLEEPSLEEPEVKKVAKQISEPEDDSLPEIRTGSAVIIRRGDNLWQVARRNYGAGIRYTTIFEANRDQVRDPDLIYPGQVLKVPEGSTKPVDTSNG